MSFRFSPLRVIGFVVMVLMTCVVLAYAQRPKTAGPEIMSGADIGFRIEGEVNGNQVPGTLMVRVNGRWVVATARQGGRVQPLSFK